MIFELAHREFVFISTAMIDKFVRAEKSLTAADVAFVGDSSSKIGARTDGL